MALNMRKIIIIPSFASSHFLKCAIPNWIDVLEPDIIIINESVFPNGPENKGHIDQEFRKKWCYHEDGMQLPMGFDWSETSKIIYDYQYSHNGITPLIYSMGLNYKSSDVNECFLEAISRFQPNLIGRDNKYCFPEIGDIIFPLEPDVLFHEKDKAIIQEHLSRLTPGDGIQVIWKDFLETQFYVEAINEVSPKWRRFAYCFDTMDNYKNAMNAFMTQNYKSLRKVDDFIGFHYPWWCPEPWKQLRYELIWRKDPQYWKSFEEGLQEIRQMSQIYVDYLKPNCDGTTNMNKVIPLDKILIRPSRTDEGRWAKFIDISHPIHIQNHPNFVK